MNKKVELFYLKNICNVVKCVLVLNYLLYFKINCNCCTCYHIIKIEKSIYLGFTFILVRFDYNEENKEKFNNHLARLFICAT